MSFNLVQDCIDLRPGIFTPAQKFALIVICRFADDDGKNSFPKLKTIAERSEFNRRTILEAVKFLISAGWVSAVRNQYGRSFTVNLGKIRQNQIVDSEVQDHAHAQEVVHVQETAHRCAGSCTAEVQDHAHAQEVVHVQETAHRCAGSCTAEVQDHAHIRNQLRNQLKNQVEAPIGAQPEVAPWELPLEPPAANYADSTLKPDDKPAQTQDSHTADTPAAKAKSATKSDRGTRFTLETLPPEWVAECDRIDPELDPQKVFDDFRDYWVALPGAKGRKSDWLATWRNWLRRIRPQERERLKKEVSQFTVFRPACQRPVIQLTDEERRRLSQGPVLDDGEDYDHELESELKELLA